MNQAADGQPARSHMLCSPSLLPLSLFPSVILNTTSTPWTIRRYFARRYACLCYADAPPAAASPCLGSAPRCRVGGWETMRQGRN